MLYMFVSGSCSTQLQGLYGIHMDSTWTPCEIPIYSRIFRQILWWTSQICIIRCDFWYEWLKCIIQEITFTSTTYITNSCVSIEDRTQSYNNLLFPTCPSRVWEIQFHCPWQWLFLLTHLNQSKYFQLFPCSVILELIHTQPICWIVSVKCGWWGVRIKYI